MRTRQSLYLLLILLAVAVAIVRPQVMSVARATPNEQEPHELLMSDEAVRDAIRTSMMYKELQQRMVDLDARLEALVVEMNDAGRSEKVDAIALALTELISQRKIANEQTMTMLGWTVGVTRRHEFACRL